MSKSIAHRVAANVRAELTRNDIRQPQVTAALSLSQSAVSRRLRGQVDFTITELSVVAKLIGIEARDLIPDGAR